MSDVGDVSDPTTSKEAIVSPQSNFWIDTMEDEMTSMSHNKVWSLVDFPYGCRLIGCKWVFKTKCYAKGQVERYKARLVVKGYSQREGIDFKETFCPVSIKVSLYIIMAIMAHFDFELHRMDVRTSFLNGDLVEDVCISQPTGFEEVGEENMVCKLQKSIYGLKHASRQWYLKFDEVVTAIGFKENIVDQCIYMKVNGSKYIFLVLHIDDILLVANDTNFLVETKQLYFSHFNMKDLGEASYVLGIQIIRDRPNGIMKLSQHTYIERILKRFNMQSCSSSKAPIVKGDRFSKDQCPQNDIEIYHMKAISYSSIVGNLMYAQVFTRLDIAFVVGMLGRYLSVPSQSHWKAAKKVLRFFQGTRNLMLTYRRTDTLEVVGFSDFDYTGCVDDKKIHFWLYLYDR